MQNLPNQTYQTKPTQPNIPNQTKPNLPNQTYWSKQSTPGPVVPLTMFADCLTGSIFQKAKLKGNLGWLMGIFCRKTWNYVEPNLAFLADFYLIVPSCNHILWDLSQIIFCISFTKSFSWGTMVPDHLFCKLSWQIKFFANQRGR